MPSGVEMREEGRGKRYPEGIQKLAQIPQLGFLPYSGLSSAEVDAMASFSDVRFALLGVLLISCLKSAFFSFRGAQDLTA